MSTSTNTIAGHLFDPYALLGNARVVIVDEQSPIERGEMIVVMTREEADDHYSTMMRRRFGIEDGWTILSLGEL